MAFLKKLLQGDEKKLKDGVVFLTVHDVGATYQVDQNDRFDISFFDISLSELGDFLERREHGRHPRQVNKDVQPGTWTHCAI